MAPIGSVSDVGCIDGLASAEPDAEGAYGHRVGRRRCRQASSLRFRRAAAAICEIRCLNRGRDMHPEADLFGRSYGVH